MCVCVCVHLSSHTKWVETATGAAAPGGETGRMTVSRQTGSGGGRVAAAGVATVRHVYLSPLAAVLPRPRLARAAAGESPYGTGYVARGGLPQLVSGGLHY